MRTSQKIGMEAIVGKPSQPLPLKILKGRGNGKDIAGRAIPQPPAFNRGAPTPPDWLNPEARGEWERIAPELERLDLIKPEDRGIFAAYCLAWSRLVRAEAICAAEGLTLTNPTTGRVGTHPAALIAAAASRDLLRLGSQFGLSPLGEVGVAKPAKPAGDEFDAFGGAS
jgi:P27 family predicted phage terminase small subunit